MNIDTLPIKDLLHNINTTTYLNGLKNSFEYKEIIYRFDQLESVKAKFESIRMYFVDDYKYR